MLERLVILALKIIYLQLNLLQLPLRLEQPDLRLLGSGLLVVFAASWANTGKPAKIKAHANFFMHNTS